MATVREYIKAKLSRFDLELDEAEMQVLLTTVGATDNTQVDTDASIVQAKTAIASIIPELLLEADVTEGGYSKKRDKSGIRDYYAMLCKELGIENKLLSPAPTISDASNRW